MWIYVIDFGRKIRFFGRNGHQKDSSIYLQKSLVSEKYTPAKAFP